jgi:hypothetical protein
MTSPVPTENLVIRPVEVIRQKFIERRSFWIHDYLCGLDVIWERKDDTESTHPNKIELTISKTLGGETWSQKMDIAIDWHGDWGEAYLNALGVPIHFNLCYGQFGRRSEIWIKNQRLIEEDYPQEPAYPESIAKLAIEN